MEGQQMQDFLKIISKENGNIIMTAQVIVITLN
jgi:hypothetical protein